MKKIVVCLIFLWMCSGCSMIIVKGDPGTLLINQTKQHEVIPDIDAKIPLM